MDETEYDTDDTEDTVDGGELPPLGVGSLGDFGRLYQQRMLAVETAAKRQGELRKQAFEKAQQQIEANQYGAPTQSERLMQIAAALVAPSKVRGFGGTMAKVIPVWAEQQTAARKATDQRRAALAQLQQQYLEQQATGQAQTAADALAALKPLIPLYKPQTPKNPYSGAVWDAEAQRWRMLPGAEGGPPVLTPEQVAQYARDPRNRGMEFYTTDGRPMRIK